MGTVWGSSGSSIKYEKEERVEMRGRGKTMSEPVTIMRIIVSLILVDDSWLMGGVNLLV